MPPLLYAHRGASAELPENTLPAFRRALERGAGALEMDVRLTRDGRVVVAHDATGSRMCGVDAEIRLSLWSEVERWDAGRGFTGPDGARPLAGQGLRIPLLEEVLQAFPGVPLNLDVKQADPPMVEPLLALLRALDAEDRVTLASFDEATLRDVRGGYRGPTALAPSEVAAALTLPAAEWAALPARGQAAQIPLAYRGIPLDTPEIVALLHERGLRVDYWTVNDAATAERLLALGADGIMTDDPALLAPLFAARR